MVKRKYVLCIAFIAIILSTVLMVTGEVLTISFNSPSQNPVTVTVNYVNISVRLNEPGVATLKWNGGNDEPMIGSGTDFFINKTNLANGQYFYFVIAKNTTSGNSTSSETRSVTVNVTAPILLRPILSNQNPLFSATSTFNFSQNFNVTVDQTAYISWKIDGSEVQNLSVSAGAKSEYISNANQPIGTYSVTATAYNTNGTSVLPMTWIWRVIPSQGPPPVSGISYTRGATWINWTWINPDTGNFNNTVVTINTMPPNYTKNNYFNLTQLAPGSTNTIYLQTVDNSGIINSTTISNSAKTFNTVTGSNVNITLNNNNVNVVFSQVKSDGDTSVIISSVNTGGPLTFQNIGNFYDISTNATFSGNVTVEIPYNPASINESLIKLYHWNYITSKWEDATTSLKKDIDKVSGNVITLSPFVAGVPPTPVITKSPNQVLVETTGNQIATFNVYTDQTTNIVWYLDGNQANISSSVAPGVTVTYNVSAAKGVHNVSVIATNTTTFASKTAYWNLSVHSTTYSSGNRIWDGERYPADFSTTYTWTPQSFSGFFYDAKDDVGSENIKIKSIGRTISENNILYSTTPNNVSFAHKDWGKYQVVGFMADKYFAGYKGLSNTDPTSSFDDVSAIAQGELHKVIFDDDTKRTIVVGGTLALKEGYVLQASDIDLNARTMFLRLLKDGAEVDSTPLSKDETYVYKKRVGNTDDLPLILVRFDNVFSGQELQAAFLKGIFQISEDITQVKSGNQFGNMEVTAVNKDKIEMQNRNDIGLNKGGIIDLMGDLKIVVADNDFLRFALSVDRKGGLEVRSTVFRETDATPITEWTPYNFGMNIGKTSLGFYYNLDDGLGNEKLTMTQRNGRVIPENKLIYSTAPDEVNFIYKPWGKYQVVGFMADKYFAGYKGHTIHNPTNSFDVISALSQGELHKIIIDDDTKRTISVGGTIALQEGYVLQASDIDLNARTMFLRLLKNGEEVDSTPLAKDETYVYKKRVGNVDDLPLILVRFDNVFSGKELQAAFIKGIFQLSENATTVKVGDQYGKMEVSAVNKDKVEMENSGDIGLDSNKNEVLMGNIRLKVADNSSTLRFYFSVDVTDDMIVNQLVIGAPKKVMAGDTIKIKITAGGKAVDNASLTLDTDMGTTNKDGELNYTIPKTLKAGTYTMTATKTGYEKATLNIDIEKYVDYRLSIETPSKANQYETITIKVLWNNTVMGGASLQFDNTSIGTTDSNGEVSYKLETSGTHSITASKTSYISVSRDIDIRAPYSEFKALDINVTPNPVFTGDNFVVRSNITNVGTKSDTLPVDLIINGTVVDNRTITLTPGQIVEINFTRQEAAVSNVTVDIMGQSNLLVVQEKPINYLLIAAIATGISAVIIYVLTSKGLLSLELLKQKFGELSDKFNHLFKK